MTSEQNKRKAAASGQTPAKKSEATRKKVAITARKHPPEKTMTTARTPQPQTASEDSRLSANSTPALESDSDMSIFSPPKPLEVASTEVISDDDLATLREMEITQEAIDRVRENAALLLKPPPDFDGESCVDCGLEIEDRRRALGYYTCIECARKNERMAKLYSHR